MILSDKPAKGTKKTHETPYFKASNWSTKPRGIKNSTEKYLLVVLANYVGKDFDVWPSQETLAEKCERSVKQIQRLLASLEKRGLIRITKKRRGGQYPHNVYTLLVDVPEKSELPPCDTQVPDGTAHHATFSDSPCDISDAHHATSGCPTKNNLEEQIIEEQLFSDSKESQDIHQEISEENYKGESEVKDDLPVEGIEIPQLMEMVIASHRMRHNKFIPTSKDYGQLKHVRNKIAAEGLSPPEVLRCVLEDWVSFTKLAEVEAGYYDSPNLPTVGFMLKCVGSMMRLYQRHTEREHAEAVLQEAMQQQAKEGPVVVAIPKKPPKPPATKDEIFSIWSD